MFSHLLIHALAVALAWTVRRWRLALWRLPADKPAAYGRSLPVIYGVWLLVLLLLYPLCRWFAASSSAGASGGGAMCEAHNSAAVADYVSMSREEV